MAAPTAGPRLPVFVFERTFPERRTAGTGGIERIETRYNRYGAFVAKITGELLPALPRETAENYNTKYPNRRGVDLVPALVASFEEAGRSAADARTRAHALAEKYEASHLWGPGFGDEAAAGVMWAHKHFNQGIQNRLLEKLQRRWRDQLLAKGYKVRIEATATAFPPDTLKRLGIHPRLKFLQEVLYKVWVVYPSGDERSFMFGAAVNEPSTDPDFELTTFSFHAFDELSAFLG